MSKFKERLEAMVSSMASATVAANTPEERSLLMAELGEKSGRTIAMVCDGNQSAIDDMLFGFDKIVTESAVDFSALVQLLEETKRSSI